MSTHRPSVLRRLRILVFAALTPTLFSCSLQPSQVPQDDQVLELRGSSSSFAAPAYWRWFNGLAVRENINADLSVMGSGDSIRQFLKNQVDFAGTDSAPTNHEIKSAKRGLLAFPVTAGAIAIAYNHPGCKLKLNRQQLVQVFLGKLRDFAQLGCAPQSISLLHREDASGSTANLTATLASVSPVWKQGPGAGRLVRWPQGTGVRGSDGMVERLLSTPGAIGYIEATYVRLPLQSAALQNQSGSFQMPTAAASAEALGHLQLDKNLFGGNPDPMRGYPIVSMNWMLVPRQGLGKHAEGLRTSLRYILSQAGQDDAEMLGYVPIPSSIRVRALSNVSQIQK